MKEPSGSRHVACGRTSGMRMHGLRNREGKASSEDTPSSGAASSEAAGEDISKKSGALHVCGQRPARGSGPGGGNYNKVFEEKLNCTLKVNWIGWAEYKNKYPLLFSSGGCLTWLTPPLG